MKFDELLESYDPVEAEYIEAFGDCDPVIGETDPKYLSFIPSADLEDN